MDYLHGHLAEAYFHDRRRRQHERDDVRLAQQNWLQSINAMAENGGSMQTAVVTVKFVDVTGRAWVDIPGDFSRAISLVVSIRWTGARHPPPSDAPAGKAQDGNVSLTLYDRIGDEDFWCSLTDMVGTGAIGGTGRADGAACGRFICPIGPHLGAQLTLGRDPRSGSPPGELDEATLKVFWRSL